MTMTIIKTQNIKETNEYLMIYRENNFDQNEMNKIDVLIEKAVDENELTVAEEYLSTIINSLKNHHNLGDLEVQEMIDKAFNFAEYDGARESA